jgi:hypothetical protein
MSNKTTIYLCITLVLAIGLLTFTVTMLPARTVRVSESGPIDVFASTSAPAPIPSTPDTAAPTIPIEETTTTTLPRRTPTTTEPPALPDVQGESVARDATAVSLDDPDMARWRQIALCEMPGPGGIPSEPWGAHWTFVGSPNGFSGAYGIANSTWRAFSGTEFGPTAGHATWQEQTIVARRIRDRYGYSAWGCGK